MLTAAAGTKADDFRHRFSTKTFEAAGDSALPALYYYGYRYYAPRHGRRLSRDPIDEEGGLLLYGFCGNGPLGAVDALGLEHWGLTWYGKAATEDRGQVEATPEKPLRPDQWTKRTSEYYDLDYEGTSGELMSLREAKSLAKNSGRREDYEGKCTGKCYNRGTVVVLVESVIDGKPCSRFFKRVSLELKVVVGTPKGPLTSSQKSYAGQTTEVDDTTVGVDRAVPTYRWGVTKYYMVFQKITCAGTLFMPWERNYRGKFLAKAWEADIHEYSMFWEGGPSGAHWDNAHFSIEPDAENIPDWGENGPPPNW